MTRSTRSPSQAGGLWTLDWQSRAALCKRGEEIDITERGAVIARLVPAQPRPLADLIASGKLRPPTVPGLVPRPGGPVRIDHEAGELLRELRDEERY